MQLRAKSLSANSFQIPCYAMNRYTTSFANTTSNQKENQRYSKYGEKRGHLSYNSNLAFLYSKYAEMRIIDSVYKKIRLLFY